MLQALHGFLLVIDVLGLDGQAEAAVLPIHINDLGFNRVAHGNDRSGIFDPINTDIGHLQVTGHFLRQLDRGALGIHFHSLTRHDGAPVVIADI